MSNPSTKRSNEPDPLLSSATEPLPFAFPEQGEIIQFGNVNYVMGNPLGFGAFGAVYECTDDWGNELAAKVLHPLGGRTLQQVRVDWWNELQRLLLLRHPQITFVYTAFEYKNLFYLVMERCTHTLHDVIRLPNSDGDIWLPYVARDILQGLEYIHNAGYVHKDIHPGNVFVSQAVDRMVPSKDRVWSFKIGDLGISNLEADINVFNTLLAQWMLPPEYLDPQFGSIGRAVDIYHTGLLLLGLLLRNTPDFSAEEILRGQPREIAERHPSPFAPAVARALRRHVAERTPSPIQFWRDIATVIRVSNATPPD